VDADVKEASVGGAPLETTGEEAVVDNKVAVVDFKEASLEITEEETLGDNEVVADVKEASVGGADLETTDKKTMGENEAAVVDGKEASVGGAPIAVAEDMEDKGADVTEASVAGAHVEAPPVEAMGDDNVHGDEASVCAAVIEVTQEENMVENVAFGSVVVEGFVLESTSDTNTDSSAADDRGNSIDQIATTNRSLGARKSGKVLPKSDREVIDLEAIPSSTFNESHHHLFIFPASMSRETKLKYILTSEFVDAASVWNGKICMFMNSSRNKCELLYSDFTCYKNKSFTTCNVIKGFFNLLSEHFLDNDVAFGTTFDGVVYNTGLKLPIKKLCEVLKYCCVESIYLPLNMNDNHWILVVINWPGYRVDVYDSLDS
jgi:hypothetical protein